MPWRHPPTTSRLVIAARVLLLAAPPALVATVGVVVALRPPPSVSGTGRLLLYAWALALLVGGVLVLLALFVRHPRHTLAGQALIAAAAGFYALHLLTVPHGVAAAGLIGASGLGALGDVLRHLDMARWRRAERLKAVQRHPAGR